MVKPVIDGLIHRLKRVNAARRHAWESPPMYEIRGRAFQLKERLRGYPALHRRFEARTGYPLSLGSPRSFNEKIATLKVSPVHPLMRRAVDKVAAKDLALDLAARHGLSLRVARTLAVVRDPESLPWDQLPNRFVLKASHRSGANLFIDRRHGFNRQQLEQTCREWLSYPYGVYKHEWAYWGVPRRLLVEELLEPAFGGELLDYKFHMSRGQCLMVQVNLGFHSGDRRLAILAPPWQFQSVHWEYPPPDFPPAVPANLKDMLAVASALSRDFSYVRIDLYSFNMTDSAADSPHIYFGEFTFYPTSGCARVVPRSFDDYMGSLLRL